jgi:hypothetical protein
MDQSLTNQLSVTEKNHCRLALCLHQRDAQCNEATHFYGRPAKDENTGQ